MEITFQRACILYLCLLFGYLIIDAPRTGVQSGKQISYPHFEGFNTSKGDRTFHHAILMARDRTDNAVVTSEAITKQKDRIGNINHWCREGHLFKNWIYKHRNTRFYYCKNYNFNYCKVDKVGGTFWLQLFFVLQNDNETKWEMFFNTPRYKIHHSERKYVVPFNAAHRTILTSRDPYSRLYAVYIDKIYLPVQWKHAKKVGRFTLNSSAKTNKGSCRGKNVSFADYLHHIIKEVREGLAVNRHLAPITALCKPCETDYFIHVKQESFADDIEYTLQTLNVSANKVRTLQDVLHGHRAEYSLPGIIDSVMLKGRAAKKCLTRWDIAARLWVSFQIQGYIDESLAFPEDDGKESSNFTAAEFKDLVLQTINTHPLTSQQSKLQRKKALVNAYRTVDTDTIQAIQEIYYPDFKLFGYSLEPPS